MGGSDWEFDTWLERALARELGWVRRSAPSHDWTRPRPRYRRRLVSAGGALALNGVAGLIAAALAVGATGTAMTVHANPVAWGHAVQEATVEALPIRAEPAATPAVAAALAPAPAASMPTRGASRDKKPAAAHGASGHTSKPVGSTDGRGHAHGSGGTPSIPGRGSHS